MRKKTMLRLVVLALAAILLLAGTVLAADPTYTITINNATEGYIYEAYQVFSGDLSGAVLSNIQWGTGVDDTTILTELQEDETIGSYFVDCTNAADVAEVLATSKTGDTTLNFASNSANLDAFAAVVGNNLGNSSGTGSQSDDTYTISNLPAGYYFVKNTAVPAVSGAYTKFILNLTDNTAITPKADVPTVNKSVKDTDDQWGESADWEIGSDVPFQLVGTLPSNYDDYETYKYVFHDTLQNTLKYNGDVKVYVQNDETKTEITTGFTVDPSTAATAGGGTLTVTFANLKTVDSVSATSKIIVEYTAELLNTAEIGQPGNKNEVYLEYSNNPNQTGEGTPSTSNTPKDEVLVFTYELDVTKVDGQKPETKLANAEFVLLNSDRTKVAKVTDGKFVAWMNVPTAVDGKITYPEGTTLTSDNNGEFVIAGLDAGTYYLRETKAPTGYNLLKNDIAVTITATLDKTEDNPALTALKLSVKEDKDGATATESDGVLDTGIVSTNVANNSGTQLPETGGIGTTIFYVLGSMLVLAAVVLLVIKKRMSTND